MNENDSIIERFHRDGYVVIPDVLSKEQCQALIHDIQANEFDTTRNFRKHVVVVHRMFEVSQSHFDLFFQEPTVSLAEQIIRDPVLQEMGDKDFTGYNANLECHVIHNNSIVVEPSKPGIDRWHQDDAPHYIVKDGEKPKNVHLPVLAMTANYYLTDVTSVENGPTAFIRGSHLFGKPCPAILDESQYEVEHAFGKAGTLVLFNCQVWHRGGPNTSEVTRYVSQVSYARRMIGHKHYPFVQYSFPDHLVSQVAKDSRKKRLTGFLSHGPYG